MANEEFAIHNLPDPTPGQDWESTGNTLRTDKNVIVKDRFIADDQETKMLHGQRFARRATSGNYTTSANDYLIAITSLAVAPSIGLPKPSMAGNGKTFIIKDEVGGAATTTITIASDGERLIDGGSSTTITTNYGSRRLYTDGTDWFII